MNGIDKYLADTNILVYLLTGNIKASNILNGNI